MDILSLLKELKNIEPSKDFSSRSRSLIFNENKLASPAGRPAIGIWQILRSNVEFGASLALMVALLYIMLGGFSTWKVSAPLQVSNLDPASLKAEAQAVDVQIQLTNLNYKGGPVDSLKLSESTPASAPQGKKSAGQESAVGYSSLKSTSTQSEAPSVDEALDKLSQ